MAGQDYGPKGCCGPSAFAMLALIVGAVTAVLLAVLS
jgi:hypothetical protein